MADDHEPDGAHDTIGVMVVDDIPLFRGVLRDLVAATRGMVLVGEAESGEEALAMAGRLAPRLVIIDMQMPVMDGVETTRHLTSRHPGTVVVLISAADEDPELARSCGASAFMRKQRLSPRVLREVWQMHGAAAERPRGG